MSHDRGMTHIFDRILCGVDDSAAGATAARLAARVSLPESSLELVSVEDPKAVAQAGMYATPAAVDIAGAARAALERGTEEAAAHPPVDHAAAEGAARAVPASNEIERIDATLVVVGSHDYSRPVGIVLGSVATHMLHEAPCSVLIAREPRDAFHWPRSIVVGIDGSQQSADAAAVARQLAERFEAKLRCVVAPAGEADLEAAREIAQTRGARGQAGRRVDGAVRVGRPGRRGKPRPEGPQVAGQRQRARRPSGSQPGPGREGRIGPRRALAWRRWCRRGPWHRRTSSSSA